MAPALNQYNPRVAATQKVIGTGVASVGIAGNGDVTLVGANGVGTLYDVYTGVVAAPAFLPDGIIVEDATTGLVSIIDGGQARSLSAQVYLYLGNPQPTTISDAQYTAIPTGPAYYPSGMIVADASNGNLSIIDGGLACPLNTEVYQYLGDPAVTSISDASFTTISTGREPPQRHDRPGRRHRRPQHH